MIRRRSQAEIRRLQSHRPHENDVSGRMRPPRCCRKNAPEDTWGARRTGSFAAVRPLLVVLLLLLATHALGGGGVVDVSKNAARRGDTLPPSGNIPPPPPPPRIPPPLRSSSLSSRIETKAINEKGIGNSLDTNYDNLVRVIPPSFNVTRPLQEQQDQDTLPCTTNLQEGSEMPNRPQQQAPQEHIRTLPDWNVASKVAADGSTLEDDVLVIQSHRQPPPPPLGNLPPPPPPRRATRMEGTAVVPLVVDSAKSGLRDHPTTRDAPIDTTARDDAAPDRSSGSRANTLLPPPPPPRPQSSTTLPQQQHWKPEPFRDEGVSEATRTASEGSSSNVIQTAKQSTVQLPGAPILESTVHDNQEEEMEERSDTVQESTERMDRPLAKEERTTTVPPPPPPRTNVDSKTRPPLHIDQSTEHSLKLSPPAVMTMPRIDEVKDIKAQVTLYHSLRDAMAEPTTSQKPFAHSTPEVEPETITEAPPREPHGPELASESNAVVPMDSRPDHAVTESDEIVTTSSVTPSHEVEHFMTISQSSQPLDEVAARIPSHVPQPPIPPREPPPHGMRIEDQGMVKTGPASTVRPPFEVEHLGATREPMSATSQGFRTRQPPPPPPPEGSQHHEIRPPLAAGPLQQQSQRIPPRYAQLHHEQQVQERRSMPLRPPMQGQRPPPRQSSTPSSWTSWKSVWRKIERGLEGLADLDEVMTEKAQQLYSATVSGVQRPMRQFQTQPASIRNHIPPPPGRRTLPATNAQPSRTEQEDIQFHLARFQKKATHVKVSSPPRFQDELSESDNDEDVVEQNQPSGAAAPNLYAVLYRKSIEPGSSVTRPSQATRQPSVGIKKIGWQDLVAGQQTRKLIRANGGASVPQDLESGPISHDKIPNAPFTNTEGARPIHPGPPPPTDVSQPRRPAMEAISSDWRAPPQSGRSPLGSAPSTPVVREKPSYMDDDDENASWLAKVSKLLPPIPRLSSLSLNPFRNRALYNGYSAATLDAWKDDEDQSAERRGWMNLFRRKPSLGHGVLALPSASGRKDDQTFTPTLAELMDRSQNGKSVSLLTRRDLKSFRSVGRTLAALDIVKLLSFLVLARQIPNLHLDMPHSVDEIVFQSVPALLVASVNSWAPFALAAAFLASKTSDLVRSAQLAPLLRGVENSVKDDASYASLYLRVLSSTPVSKETPSQFQYTAKLQAIEKVERSRLRMLILCLISTLVLMTVTLLEPIAGAALTCVSQIMSLQHWHNLPGNWKALLMEVKDAGGLFVDSVANMMGRELGSILDHPINVFYEAFVFVALLAISLFPGIEARRKVDPVTVSDAEDEVAEAHARYTEHVADLGSSSASRLDILANGRALESLLERWKGMFPTSPERKRGLSSTALLRVLGYKLVTGAILAAPLIAFGYAGIAPYGSPGSPQLRWDSLLDVSVVLLFTHFVAGRAISACVQSKESERYVSGFISSLASATEDRRKVVQEQALNLQMQSSISPTAGILVKDLWAAHTTRRAWAVRGANFWCRNGEILLLLGDAGSGKSRLLTTLAESVPVPPRQALSATRVRGSISFGGLEVNKWDKYQLNRRLGLLLTDVRTISDVSKVLSGLTIEEILEPSIGTRSFVDPSHHPSSHERAAMIIALKITGLYSTLLPRLPSKLSTVITANEEDLRPSALRPRNYLLSSVEWSKMVLTRVLTQAISDNDNAASSHERVEQCLIGSFLILDDATAYFSEVDEARLMQDLRRTGAAVIMSSNRWSIGRFADRIAVLKDGAIVESGTHNELLNRGPQQSIYAAKWHAMTAQ